MIRTFSDKQSEFIFHGDFKKARKIPNEIYKVAQRKLQYLNSAVKISDLKVPPSNKLEALKKELKGFYAIRINKQYRVIFRWDKNDAYDVKILDYHKG